MCYLQKYFGSQVLLASLISIQGELVVVHYSLSPKIKLLAARFLLQVLGAASCHLNSRSSPFFRHQE